MIHAARLCPVVEGVLFALPSDSGHPVRGLILREALEAVFDAAEDPQSWLAAFERHHHEILATALCLHRAHPASTLVLLRRRHFERPARKGHAAGSEGRDIQLAG